MAGSRKTDGKAVKRKPRAAAATVARTANRDLPGEVVLVLQGGGALGAYQVGVYEALHEAGIEPQWVIGTSIGAINAAIIAGNSPEQRLAKLNRFWQRLEGAGTSDPAKFWGAFGEIHPHAATLMRGIDGFFAANPHAGWGLHAPLGVENAAFYSTTPLRQTLGEMVDFAYLNERHVRLTVGAVNVCTGEMEYFDNRDREIRIEHVLASGALPPAFPAVRVGDGVYWDGGVYSNTPVEVVFDDRPRRDAVIFMVNLWQPRGAAPETIWQVFARHKDIQYASRAGSHIERQRQIHRLRHVIRALARHIPEKDRNCPQVQEMLAYGCATEMHIVPLLAPRLEREDHLKDIDFTPAGIRMRWKAGHADALRAIEAAPWQRSLDPLEGAAVHEVLE